MLSPSSTLAEIATACPGATRVFHGYGLDFCCGGQRSVGEACAARSLRVDVVLREVEEAGASSLSTRWDERPLGELVDFIESYYHARLRQQLPELLRLAMRVEERHADKPACPRGLSDHLRVSQFAVFDHLMKEELVLFPLLRSGRGALAAAPIRMMELEHDDHRETLARTRALTANLKLPPEACTTWRALYVGLLQLEQELMEHIHLENNILFRRALDEGSGFIAH
jgi:regulator of cell morphogenesis and NO signaling